MVSLQLTKVDITPQESVPMMGYGDRTSWSKGIHDPLFAYIWYVKNIDQAKAHVWIVCDLCLFSIQASTLIREALNKATGIPTDQIVISATHTHSGPNVRYLSSEGVPWEQRYYSLLLERLSEGIVQAEASAFDGSIQVRTTQIDIGVNRRGKHLPADSRVILFSLVDKTGKERAHMFHYSSHLTALGVDNYLISSDWVGPLRHELEKDLKVPFGFIQGAEGNIDPYCRGLLFMEDPNQAVGVSFEEMAEMAMTAVEPLKKALDSPVTATLDSLKTSSVTAKLPMRFGAMQSAEVEKQIAEWKTEFSQFLDLPVSEVPEDYEINALIKEKCRKDGITGQEVLKWVSRQFTYCAFLNLYRKDTKYVKPSQGVMICPVVLWDFDKLFIYGIPAEVLIENAFHLQKQCPNNIALVGGLANGWVGYLPHADNFAESNQNVLYETVSTMFAEHASDVLFDIVKEVREC